MEESFPHLPLNREEPVTEKRPGGSPRFVPPADPPAHGRMLQECLESAKKQTDEDIGGFDDRRLFRFTVNKGFDPDTLSKTLNEIAKRIENLYSFNLGNYRSFVLCILQKVIAVLSPHVYENRKFINEKLH